MPELPEVETMVRDLRGRVVGRTITRVGVYWDRLVGYPDRPAFETGLIDRRIDGIDRRGKFALFDLSGRGLLTVHRGMTGSVLLRPQAAPDDRFVRARFTLDDGTELRFDDSRKFGRLYLVESGDGVYAPPWQRLGIEPLDDDFSPSLLRMGLARRSAAIKTVLLNQSVVAGIGNIYADEALFLARIHPLRPASSLSAAEIRRLTNAIRDVLANAIEGRGTTFSTYRDLRGESGSHQERLTVFHRHGMPCLRCGAVIRRIVVSARGTHFCPRCQR